MSERILQIDNLSTHYGRIPMLNNLSMYLKRGEITCVLGANGAGKSTLLKAILSMVKADTGDIIFDNRVYDVGAYYTFGNFSWDIIYMTMTDNTDIASIYKKSEKRANKELERLVKNYSELN